MTLLYEAGRQLLKVRLVFIFSLIFAAGFLWWGVDLSRTYGTAPGDGGKLAPLPVRLAWGFGVGLLGVAFAAGMGVYVGCYAVRIEGDRESGRLRFVTAGFPAVIEVDRSQIVGTSDYHGQFDGVNAPWQSVRVRGRRLPLIVDEQGKFYDRKTLRRLLS